MKHTEKFIRNRRFYMILPALTIPFLTVIFWALGGGQGQAEVKVIDAGLNARVPAAQFSNEEEWNKLSLYERADRDSAEFREKRESDPYFDLMAIDQNPEDREDSLMYNFRHRDRLAPDPNEVKVQQKLDELYREMAKVPEVPDETMLREGANNLHAAKPVFGDAQRTNDESDKSTAESETSLPDPEMQEINQMIDKLMLLQNPPKPEQFNKPARETWRVAKAKPLSDTLSGAEQLYIIESDTSNVIEAVIHNTQTLVSGAVVRLRLVQDIVIKNVRIARDQIIYGISSINGERLIIKTATIRKGGLLLPVSLSVYDLDGLEGIYIPGAIARDAAKQAGDDAISNLQFMSMDQSIQQQAAAAGLEATKGLLSKKAKLIKVTVKAGYRVLLLDTGANQ